VEVVEDTIQTLQGSMPVLARTAQKVIKLEDFAHKMALNLPHFGSSREWVDFFGSCTSRPRVQEMNLRPAGCNAPSLSGKNN
jgi:hypothetical protein